jgi:hypothetical protein
MPEPYGGGNSLIIAERLMTGNYFFRKQVCCCPTFDEAVYCLFVGFKESLRHHDVKESFECIYVWIYGPLYGPDGENPMFDRSEEDKCDDFFSYLGAVPMTPCIRMLHYPEKPQPEFLESTSLNTPSCIVQACLKFLRNFILGSPN